MRMFRTPLVVMMLAGFAAPAFAADAPKKAEPKKEEKKAAPAPGSSSSGTAPGSSSGPKK